jgi:hypothetical protein
MTRDYVNSGGQVTTEDDYFNLGPAVADPDFEQPNMGS